MTGKAANERRTLLWLALGVALILVVALFLRYSYFGNENPPAPPTSTAEPVDVEFEESTSLKVPETKRIAQGSFEVEEGMSYLVQFEVSTVKPEGSPGEAMFLGVSLNCSGTDGMEGKSVGGTQNLITGEDVELRNQFVLFNQSEGEQACNVSISAPYPDVAAEGALIEVDARWTAKEADGELLEADADKRLPMAISTGQRQVALAQPLDLDVVRGQTVNVLSSIHLTACTGVNGSSEDGKTWCDAGSVNPEGSTVDLVMRADLLDAEGQVCGEAGVTTRQVQIDRRTHHLLANTEEAYAIPRSACGDSLRVTITVANHGPAPVVVHRSASTLVIADGELDGKEPPEE